MKQIYQRETSKPAQFLVLDQCSFLLLAAWARKVKEPLADASGKPIRVFGLQIVVLDVPELCTVAGDPWEDAMRGGRGDRSR